MVLVYNTICQLYREFNFMLVHVGHHMVRKERENMEKILYVWAHKSVAENVHIRA